MQEEGLGVLLSRGMPAWMKALCEPSPRPTCATRTPLSALRDEIPEGVAQDMVQVMTEIVLAACVKEAVA